jgi:two-component system sensor histidine kinase CiaH
LSYLLAEQTLKPIEENMESQAQFVSDASHELRTPLTSMKVSNEVALRNNNLNINEARNVLEGNVDDINRLEHLTAALLNLSKNDPIIIEPMVDARTCIATALTTVAPRAVERNISIDDKTKEVYLRANQQALVQIIAILLDNAVKYSRENQSITISTSSTTKTVSIVITDHGIGMDANTIEHIYTRFYRADKARTFAGNSGGYGLGLPIAQKLAVAMKGAITASSTPGKGTKMTVTLPRARAK